MTTPTSVAEGSIPITVDDESSPTTGEDSPTTTSTRVDDESGQILVVGDWGSRTSSQQEVAAAMAEHAETNEIEAILTTGDNFYSDDIESMMEPFAWAIDAGIPFLITWGNHDIESDTRVAAVNAVFGSPPRHALYEWGSVDVVILDSNKVGSQEQEDFLVASLAASEDPTVLVFHHPMFSCGPHGNTEPIIDQWTPLFDDDVFLVLNGHDHSYQRFGSEGVTYIVTGGGGARTTGVDRCDSDDPGQLAGESVNHFLVMNQSDGLTITSIDVDGEVIDLVELDLP